MSWELIHRRLLHPSGSVIKAMCRHQTLDGLPKHCPKKIYKTPCKSDTQQKLQLSPREQQLTPVTSNQDNLFTWTYHFTTSLQSIVLLPCSQ